MWDLAFPKTCLGCGRLLRDDLSLALCTVCRPQQARLPLALAQSGKIRAQWAYEGPLSQAVVALKFSGALALAGPLGQLLAEDPRLCSDAQGHPIDLLIPIPLHWQRRLFRGFDQSEQLARWALHHAAHRSPNTPRLAHRLLRRVRATSPQTTLDARDRLANVAGAFELRDPRQVVGRRVLLLDDVTTTGSTARACMRCVEAAGASGVETLALLRAL